MPRLELFAFRLRDPRTGKWVRARHRCEQHELQERYAEFEIIGEPEICNADPDARYFNPHRPPIGNWRITFAFEGEDATRVDLEDYH